MKPYSHTVYVWLERPSGALPLEDMSPDVFCVRRAQVEAGMRNAEHNHVLQREREFFIDNLLVRIHFIIEMFWWTGLAPWEFEFPFSGSLISTFLKHISTFLS